MHIPPISTKFVNSHFCKIDEFPYFAQFTFFVLNLRFSASLILIMMHLRIMLYKWATGASIRAVFVQIASYSTVTTGAVCDSAAALYGYST